MLIAIAFGLMAMTAAATMQFHHNAQERIEAFESGRVETANVAHCEGNPQDVGCGAGHYPGDLGVDAPTSRGALHDSHGAPAVVTYTCTGTLVGGTKVPC